jgi:hypothetical protein
MIRPSRSVAGLCIAVIAIAAFLPGLSLDFVVFEPQWVLLPDDAPVAVCVVVPVCDEQPAPLLSLLNSRGPPSPQLA